VNYLAQLEKLTWKLDEGDGVLGTPLFLLSFSFPLVLSFLLLSLDATFVYVCLFVLCRNENLEIRNENLEIEKKVISHCAG
jgi:hypothetical protein